MANRGGTHKTAGGAPITGKVGEPPPPGAPIEQAAPVQQAWVDAAARLARTNEQTLPDFNPKGTVTPDVARAREVDALNASTRRARPPVTQQADGTINMPIIITDAHAPDPVNDAPPGPAKSILQSMGEAVLAAQHAQDEAEGHVHDQPRVVVATVDGIDLGVIAVEQPPAPPAPAPVTADQILEPPPAPAPQQAITSKLGQAARNLLSSRARVAQPAASNTDSPSRGVPQQPIDPGKRITGGFGESLDQQYFPLDGNELREVVLGLMDKLVAQIQNDLRFSMAVVYPRVSATVTIKVQGYTSETDFTIPKRAEHLRTPVDVAEATGAVPVEITLENNIAEFSEDGQSLTPPNVMRRELGMQVPKKQRVAIPTGYAVVDRTT